MIDRSPRIKKCVIHNKREVLKITGNAGWVGRRLSADELIAINCRPIEDIGAASGVIRVIHNEVL